ncbi:signal transduction histidine kinase regulating citrate/malate metabolism [Desulfofarcimen acetoxidans DSM 771]|uniref:Signal transduction histidine kinase regulating citrate/malate metabolism n=1 Tax=Desulfofarcimen acetoxidans (strain ATCC 49208 / DSM 771 / KCTC 5769 / VKM B-1644 / 5575) TaxID=485916 RepID=C8W547_DESAS|nr:signal transduction histidine kinase regulating citrate/malate metabolism [Desulfofarcimen acetoxidans DSM 771]
MIVIISFFETSKERRKALGGNESGFTVTIRKIEEYAEKDCEAKRNAENLKQINQLINSSRKHRHDFHHQLQAIYGLLESGSYEGAKNYINSFFGTITKTRELIETDNVNVSAILNTKVGLAEARNIDLEVGVECNLKELPLSSFDVSSLLGNLIDNALEAVENNESEHRQVKVMIDFERGQTNWAGYPGIYFQTRFYIKRRPLQPGSVHSKGHHSQIRRWCRSEQ